MKTKIFLYLVFVAIVIMPATTNAEDPTAVATATDVTTAGGTLYSFTVLYADDGEIDVGSIGNNDVGVTGPGGFDVVAAYSGRNCNSNFQLVPRHIQSSRRAAIGIMPTTAHTTS